MSAQEFFEKYKQLDANGQKQIDEMLERLSKQVANGDEKKPSSLFGSWKGQIEMAPDFDEPIEDFKDYK